MVPVGNALEFKWPALDQYKAPTTAAGVTQSAIYAGFQLFYKGEITQRTYSDAALDMITFKIVDLTGFTTLSRDLIADNYIAMDAMAQRVFARGFQWMEDYMSIQGPGVGKPQGYFYAMPYSRAVVVHRMPYGMRQIRSPMRISHGWLVVYIRRHGIVPGLL